MDYNTPAPLYYLVAYTDLFSVFIKNENNSTVAVKINVRYNGLKTPELAIKESVSKRHTYVVRSSSKVS